MDLTSRDGPIGLPREVTVSDLTRTLLGYLWIGSFNSSVLPKQRPHEVA